ncbi:MULTISPECIES: DUF4157 domain-containing protein [unclassified Kitasatospora]|uniref:eCIS core domain-containing protein n=1 Tax=unclassified Kitasatospora TaxID=2633591 RepID=UPI00247457B5|nr:DUF4157 domain-containing protein [Kitasatospora sp. MAP12-44]
MHDVLRSGGRPLDSATRTDMESRLGADFADVRLHTDTAARASAAEVGARAYTSGSHVVIGEGGGDSHTLAHELTHVIQQRAGSVAGTDNGAGLRVSDPSDRFEREAESNARRVMGSSPGGLATHGGGEVAAARSEAGQAPAVQRAIGLEIEVDRPVVKADGTPVREEDSTGHELMKHKRQGIKLVSDLRNLPGGGTYTNAEFVANPSAALPGEESRYPSLATTLDNLEQAHARLYQPQVASSTSDKEMQSIFPTSAGYTPQPGYEQARVAPENPHNERSGQRDKGDGLFAHQTVGVPLHGMAGFFAHALNEPEPLNPGGRKIRISPRHDSHLHLAQSIQFGTQLAQRFVQSNVNDATPRDPEELRGFGALLYTQLAALTDGLRTDGQFAQGQMKNKTAALSRVSLDKVGRTLSTASRRYLTANATLVIGLFRTQYGQVHPFPENQPPPFPQQQARYLDRYARSALGTGDESQSDAFGGMTELDGLDMVGGVPIVPLEMRSFGPSLTGFANLRRDAGLLSDWSNEAFHGAQQARAQQARAGQQAPLTPIEATAPVPEIFRNVVNQAYQEGLALAGNTTVPFIRNAFSILQSAQTMALQGQPPQGHEVAWGNGLMQAARTVLQEIRSEAAIPERLARVRAVAEALKAEATEAGVPNVAAQLTFALNRSLR